jgi:hypothetical protein
VKERQDSIAARIAGTIAGGVRRRQQDRTPRALVYDATGEPRVVPPGSDEQRALIEAAEAVVDAVLGEEGGGDERGDAPGGAAAPDPSDEGGSTVDQDGSTA